MIFISISQKWYIFSWYSVVAILLWYDRTEQILREILLNFVFKNVCFFFSYICKNKHFIKFLPCFAFMWSIHQVEVVLYQHNWKSWIVIGTCGHFSNCTQLSFHGFFEVQKCKIIDYTAKNSFRWGRRLIHSLIVIFLLLV